jgi:hypothetical protein
MPEMAGDEIYPFGSSYGLTVAANLVMTTTSKQGEKWKVVVAL